MPMPPYANENPDPYSMYEIPLEQIRPAPWNPPARMDPETIGELLESIALHGQQIPALVRPVEAEAPIRLELVFGHRRYAAISRLAPPEGMGRIKAFVRPLRQITGTVVQEEEKMLKTFDKETLKKRIVEARNRKGINQAERPGRLSFADILRTVGPVIQAGCDRSASYKSAALPLSYASPILLGLIPRRFGEIKEMGKRGQKWVKCRHRPQVFGQFADKKREERNPPALSPPGYTHKSVRTITSLLICP